MKPFDITAKIVGWIDQEPGYKAMLMWSMDGSKFEIKHLESGKVFDLTVSARTGEPICGAAHSVYRGGKWYILNEKVSPEAAPNMTEKKLMSYSIMVIDEATGDVLHSRNGPASPKRRKK